MALEEAFGLSANLGADSIISDSGAINLENINWETPS